MSDQRREGGPERGRGDRDGGPRGAGGGRPSSGRPGGGRPGSGRPSSGRPGSDRPGSDRRGRDDQGRGRDSRTGADRSGGRDPQRDRDGRPSRGGVDRDARESGPRLVPKQGRRPEPAIDDDVTGGELDRSVRGQLRTLSKENAEGVAQHLVMVARRLEEEDYVGALAHAETVVRRAGRVPAAREALGFVAYRSGDYARALTEFRTVRRLSGSSHLLPLMVDCERGLGRPERALELLRSPEARALGPEDQVEMLIIGSGIRRDMGAPQAAVLALQGKLAGPPRPWSARLYYAYADALLDAGRRDEAREWFGKAAVADADGETDAAERLDELDGIQVIEDGVEVDEDSSPA